MLFETPGGAIVDVEIFVNSGFGHQVRCEAVCEHGSARIGDERTVVVTTADDAGEEVAQDRLVRLADAYDREVRARVDATRRGRVCGPAAWGATPSPPPPPPGRGPGPGERPAGDRRARPAPAAVRGPG
ncbi:inositol 2-dehydrogenase, partial [Streptomyces caeni]